MCFAPQRRALFQHVNFQKPSKRDSFWHFLLPHVLPATMTCTFSTSQPQKMFRAGSVFVHYSECASHHNCVQLFICHLASRLRTRRFGEPTFRHSGIHKTLSKHVKTQGFATFLPFCTPASSLFWLSPYLIFSVAVVLFHLSILSEV